MLGVKRLWLDDFPDGRLADLPPDHQLLAIDVTAVLHRKRRAAVQAHASQWVLSPFDLRQGWGPWSVEHFRLARSEESGERADVLADVAR